MKGTRRRDDAWVRVRIRVMIMVRVRVGVRVGVMSKVGVRVWVRVMSKVAVRARVRVMSKLRVRVMVMSKLRVRVRVRACTTQATLDPNPNPCEISTCFLAKKEFVPSLAWRVTVLFMRTLRELPHTSYLSSSDDSSP